MSSSKENTHYLSSFNSFSLHCSLSLIHFLSLSLPSNPRSKLHNQTNNGDFVTLCQNLPEGVWSSPSRPQPSLITHQTLRSIDSSQVYWLIDRFFILFLTQYFPKLIMHLLPIQIIRRFRSHTFNSKSFEKHSKSHKSTLCSSSICTFLNFKSIFLVLNT